MKSKALAVKVERLRTLTALFFKMLQATDDGTIDQAVPWLSHILQEYDQLFTDKDGRAFIRDYCGERRTIQVGSAFATAIDVRVFFVLFKGLPKKSPAERRKTRAELLATGFRADQYSALEKAIGLVKRRRAYEIKPMALFPIHRLQKGYQSAQTLRAAREALAS